MNEPIKDGTRDASQVAPLLDIVRSNEPLKPEMLAAIERVFDSGRFLHGPDCRQLEQSIAAICEVDQAIGCASGSDALLLSLMALGVGPGDEVITPSFTFFATASAVWRLGARPVFVDIDPVSFNLDPDLLEAAITPPTRAIIAVHLFGQCAGMDRMSAVARERGLSVVEDAAQALGARYRDRPAGGWGELGCFSFYPTKNLGGSGDGGMITTGDPDLARQLRLLASHGMHPRYHHNVVGINSRLDSLQAAVLNVKLPSLPQWNAKRRANAERYADLFAAAGLDGVIGLPSTSSGCLHVWNQYTIRVRDGRRDALRTHLAEGGIGAETYYPVPLHLQVCFRQLGYREGDLPHTERAAREVLSLPIHADLTIRQQEAVVRTSGRFFALERAA